MLYEVVTGEAIGNVQDAARRNVAYAEETNRAISDSVERANLSGEALRAIVGLIDETAGQVHSIAAAAEEQSAASEEINRAEEAVSLLSSDIARGMRESAGVVDNMARQVVV